MRTIYLTKEQVQRHGQGRSTVASVEPRLISVDMFVEEGFVTYESSATYRQEFVRVTLAILAQSHAGVEFSQYGGRRFRYPLTSSHPEVSLFSSTSAGVSWSSEFRELSVVPASMIKTVRATAGIVFDASIMTNHGRSNCNMGYVPYIMNAFLEYNLAHNDNWTWDNAVCKTFPRLAGVGSESGSHLLDILDRPSWYRFREGDIPRGSVRRRIIL